jgi:hypothetical protein
VYNQADGFRSINKHVLALRKAIPSALATDSTAVILRKAVTHIAQLEAIIESRLPGRRGSADDQCFRSKDASFRKPSHGREKSSGMAEPKDWGVKMEREGTEETVCRYPS